MSADPSQDERVLAALNAALDMGYRHIDTAEMYAGGHTEELIGQALRGRQREELFIVSKVWQTHMRYEEVLRACQGSLRRLGLDYLDMYMIHWPSRSVPLEETMRALNQLVLDGATRYIGVCNFDLDLLRQAQEYSSVPIAMNQVPYNLHQRDYARNGVLAHCREHKILLTAYTPVERGQAGDFELLHRLAVKYQADPFQIALYWLVRQPGVIAIPMSLNPAHLKSNLEALDLDLEAADLEMLDRLGAPWGSINESKPGVSPI